MRGGRVLFAGMGAQLIHHHLHIMPRVRITGIEFQGSAEVDGCLFQLPLIAQSHAQIHVSVGIVWLKFQGAAITTDGCFALSLDVEGISQIVVKDPICRVQLDGAADGLDGHARPARLERNDAEEVGDIRVIRLNGENLPVYLLGGLQAACLVVSKSDRKHFWNGSHSSHHGKASSRPQSGREGLVRHWRIVRRFAFW